ncbi:MAG: 50S ribosomal protein L23 [Candidatus Glassbacteria bacterium]|nr:50S ribosomal protein L23 [Candidatus Glassbacteria bacterium]
MKDQHQIIKRPLLTEKSDLLRETENQYCFEVDVAASKHDVKAAVEELFGVRVTKVRLQNRLGKLKKQGRSQGRRSSWKKAFVSLAADDHIELFEGV